MYKKRQRKNSVKHKNALARFETQSSVFVGDLKMGALGLLLERNGLTKDEVKKLRTKTERSKLVLFVHSFATMVLFGC